MKNLKRIFALFFAIIMCMNVATACDKEDVKKIGEPEYRAVSGFIIVVIMVTLMEMERKSIQLAKLYI